MGLLLVQEKDQGVLTKLRQYPQPVAKLLDTNLMLKGLVEKRVEFGIGLEKQRVQVIVSTPDEKRVKKKEIVFAKP